MSHTAHFFLLDDESILQLWKTPEYLISRVTEHILAKRNEVDAASLKRIQKFIAQGTAGDWRVDRNIKYEH